MMFSLLKKARSAAARFSVRGKGRPTGSSERAFSEKNCAIWNDIQRALETK
jgi:hypothetical protein